MLEFAVIGYGGRISGIVERLRKTGKAHLAAVMDIDPADVRARFPELFGEGGECLDARFYTDADEMLKKEKLDGVLIGTRCSTHTKYAVTVSKYGLPLFLEKPVSTTWEDLGKLVEILPSMNGKTVVSFPLRDTRIVTYVKEIIDSGRIGTVEHVQAWNNVPYARGYYHKWYRDENETGGLFLQKATHDLDYINYLLGDRQPVRVCAMKSKQVFKGNEPAGLKCADCPKQKECPESPQNVRKTGDTYAIGEYCCFAVDTGNEDSGSVLVEYDTGMHVAYSQDFIARKGAGARGARLIGYKGTVQFDFRTGDVQVFHHNEAIVETHHFITEGHGHFGGDNALVQNFIGVMEGTETSRTPLYEGVRSAQLCLCARKSAEKHVFVDVEKIDF